MSNLSKNQPIFASVLQRAFDKAICNSKSYKSASEWVNDTIKNFNKEEKERIKQFIYGKAFASTSYSSSICALQSELSYYEEADYDKAKIVHSTVNCLDQFISQVQYKYDASNIDLPEKENIENYLSHYFELCKVLFSNSSLLYTDTVDTDGNLQTFCAYLASAPFGIHHNIYSPYSAEALLALYNSFENITNLADISQVHLFVKKMIAAVYSTRTFRSFRHFKIRDDKPVLISCENTDYFVEKKRHNLSSFELIKPIRTFGKIKRYLKLLDTGDVCNIKLIGAVYVTSDKNKRPKNIGTNIELENYSYEMFELCQWLQLNSSTKGWKYKFNIYLNRRSMPKTFLNDNEKGKDFSDRFYLIDGNIEITFHYCDYEQLSSKDKLDSEILCNDSLVLFLDCPFLYDNLCVVSDDIPINDYFRYLPEHYSSDESSLSKLGSVQSIQNQLNMLQLDRCEKTGHFEQRLRDKMLRHISMVIKKEQEENKNYKKEIFVFISSQSSISVSEYSRFYQVRMEKYNGKEICLLHFGGNEATDLVGVKDPISKTDNNRIVFKFWDIIVNTDLFLVDAIKSYFRVESPEDKYMAVIAEYASNIVIELCWNDGETMFDNVMISIDTNEEDKVLKKIQNSIQSYFDVIFNNRCNLEQAIINCMRESFFNVFYGKIINVCQAVAFQRLREYLALRKKIKVMIKEKDDSIEHNSYDESEYSISTKKKAYIDTIINLSRDFPSETLCDILSYRMERVGLSPSKVYQQIIDACEEIKYTSTNLYINTKKLNGGLSNELLYC